MAQAKTSRVVILGGGFGGIRAALEFARVARKVPEMEVHLVSEENYCVFQPLLAEVVSGGIEPTHIVNPIRQLCRSCEFHCATVQSIDLERRTVSLVGADARRVLELKWDHLVIALGQGVDLSRIPGMAEHSFPIKTLGDAFHLRNHVLSRLEQADLEPDETVRRRLLTVVTVGAGFSGVETAAEVHDMIRAVLPFYPAAARTGHRMVLVHSRDRILNELDPGLAEFAQEVLKRRGVEILFNQRTQEATPEGVKLSDGSFLAAGTMVCTVGNAPLPIVVQSGLPKEGGRVVVEETLRVKGRSDVWAVGDCAVVPDRRRGGGCPPTAQYAVRQGRQCARNVAAAVRGEPLEPFEFGGLGQLAVVGRRRGVAQVFGLKFAGLFAWMLWRSVYWSKLPGVLCKLRVGLDWAIDLFFPRDITKFEVRRTEQIRLAHYREGDVIVRQGEIGDRFYVIEKGRVEIVREEPGQPPRRIAEKGPGESFGEVALLKDTPRTATVRCLTAVDVLSFGRADFRRLVGSYGVLRDQMERDLRSYSAPQATAALPES
jgi:NADH dehydrogenase